MVINLTPKNTFAGNKPLDLSNKYLNFQRLLCGAHLGESKEKNRPVKISVKVTEFEIFQKNKDEIEQFFEWLTDREIQFDFIKIRKKSEQKRLKNVKFDFASLYSGGLDSGAFPLIPKNRKLCGLLHHTHTSHRMLSVAKKMHLKCNVNRHKLALTELNLSSTADMPLLHVRGVMFLTNLLCVASECNTKRIIIPENGPFMINYPVSMTVSPTRTTNPVMIEDWSKLFQKITSTNIKIEMPFLNKTKAEVILESQEPKLIKYSWSCSTSQGISKMCGICMACFVRILSLYAIDQGENLENKYELNVLRIKHTSLKQKKLTSFRILINCLEHWKNTLELDLLPTNSDRESYKDLILKFPLMTDFAADMYLGLQKFFRDNSDYNVLGMIGKCYLDKLDQNVLDSRQSKLEKKIAKFKGKN